MEQFNIDGQSELWLLRFADNNRCSARLNKPTETAIHATIGEKPCTYIRY